MNEKHYEAERTSYIKKLQADKWYVLAQRSKPSNIAHLPNKMLTKWSRKRNMCQCTALKTVSLMYKRRKQ